MADNKNGYYQGETDITSISYDYGEGYSPRVDFKDYRINGEPLGCFSCKSDDDKYNTGILSEDCKYKVNGKEYSLIKKGYFPTWGKAFLTLSKPGDYKLIKDKESNTLIIQEKVKKDNTTYLYTWKNLDATTHDSSINSNSFSEYTNYVFSNPFTNTKFKDGVIPNYLIVEIQGAGGGGAGAAKGSVGGGGGSGAYILAVIDFSIFSTLISDGLMIHVGAGGECGGKSTTSTLNGQNGEYSSISLKTSIPTPGIPSLGIEPGSMDTYYILLEAGGGKGAQGQNGGDGGYLNIEESKNSDVKRYICTAPGASGGNKNSDGNTPKFVYGLYSNSTNNAGTSDITCYISYDSNYQKERFWDKNKEKWIYPHMVYTLSTTYNDGESAYDNSGGGGAGAAFGDGGDAGKNSAFERYGKNAQGPGAGGGGAASDEKQYTGGNGGNGFVRFWY